MTHAASFASTDMFHRLKRRDPDALEQVIKTYLPQIVRTARGAGLPEDQAQDVAQDVFLTFLKTLERFEGRSHVRTWIFGILYRKIAESRKSVKRSSAETDIDMVFESQFDSRGGWIRPPQSGDHRRYLSEIEHYVTDCLETIASAQRMAFVLREIEGFDTKEISGVMDVGVGHVSVLLFRARNGLRMCLESKGIHEA